MQIIARSRSGWKCFKCQALASIVGVGAMAVIIADDPEAAGALFLMKKIYGIYASHYDKVISEEKFIENTKTFVGLVSDLTFISEYPKKICHWFKQC